MNRVIEEGQLYFVAAQKLVKEHDQACVTAAKNVLDRLCSLRHAKAGATDEYVVQEILAAHPGAKKIKRTLHLCEAPGGFVNGCLALLGDKLDWHAISLAGDQSACPRFHPALKSQTRTNGRFRVHRGDDGTGDITAADNRKRLFYDIGVQSIDLVTGDAECDRDRDPPKLFAAQMVIAAMLLCEGGMLALRLPEKYAIPSVETFRWIYSLLDQWFGLVEVVAPKISAVEAPLRLYVLCTEFKGVAAEDLAQLMAYAYEGGAAGRVEPECAHIAWVHQIGAAIEDARGLLARLSALSFYLGQIGISTHERAGELYSENVIHNPGHVQTVEGYKKKLRLTSPPQARR